MLFRRAFASNAASLVPHECCQIKGTCPTTHISIVSSPGLILEATDKSGPPLKRDGPDLRIYVL